MNGNEKGAAPRAIAAAMKTKKDRWQDCRSMAELGGLERPHITAWLRHLAALPVEAAVQDACA